MAGQKRHQQLQQDLADRLGRMRHGTLASDQGAHQQWGEKHAEQAGKRGCADRSRHIAARHRGKRDRGLHRRRQRAQEQHTDIQLRRQCQMREWFEQQPEQREQHEGAAQNHQMQAPMQRAGLDRFARQPRAVQEEQRSDRHIGDIVHDRSGGARDREKRGQCDRAQQRESKRVNAQPRQQLLH